jgi:hypothetical protein
LEQEDGGIVQLIIAGKPDVKVKAEAVIEGQQHIHEVIGTVCPRIGMRDWIMVVIVVLSIGVYAFWYLMRKLKDIRIGYGWQHAIAVIGTLTGMGVGLHLSLRPFSPTLPLEF